MERTTRLNFVIQETEADCCEVEGMTRTWGARLPLDVSVVDQSVGGESWLYNGERGAGGRKMYQES